MRFVTGILVACITALPTRAQPQQSSVLPVDEAARDPEFFVFRARLQRAVASHDTAAVMRVVSPQIRNSLGGDRGRDEFRETWGIAEPDKSRLWTVLGFVLALGGQFLGDTLFFAPYTFHASYTFRGKPIDGFEALIVLGRNVMVRAEPDAGSAAIETVSFEAVAMWREKSPTTGWEPVRTSKQRTGWVLQEYLRSPIDYRAGFLRRQGRWSLRWLLAGD